ncbi:hypothetical protein WAI453_011434 [Rhynchosporium graminicola]
MKLVHLIFVPLFLVYANPLESRGANNGCPAPNGCAGICVSKTNPKGEVKDYCNTPNAQFPCGNRRNGIKSYCGGLKNQACTAYGNQETWCPADCPETCTGKAYKPLPEVCS